MTSAHESVTYDGGLSPCHIDVLLIMIQYTCLSYKTGREFSQAQFQCATVPKTACRRGEMVLEEAMAKGKMTLQEVV